MDLSFDTLLRLIPAIVFTFATAFTFKSLIGGLLRPVPAWRYVTAALLITAIWRWTVVFLGLMSNWAWLSLTWVNPISQAVYAIIGVAVLVLVVVGRRRRTDD